MRELKFRAWDKERKVWLHDASFRLSGDGKIWFNSLVQPHIETDEQVVLMQFTGLLDRNGKEIYEGDVVKVDQSLIGMFPQDVDKEIIAKVEYFVCTFYPLEVVFSRMGSTGVEVIGNIYENPHLLK